MIRRIRMDKVLAAYCRTYPNATVADFARYWEVLNECLDVRNK